MNDTTDKTPLSVIILCHRDDQRLQNALASVQFAGEVLAIEMSSNINWSRLKKKFHFKIKKTTQSQKEELDFASIRNTALKEAHYKWVLFLDSDEVLTQNSIKEIRKHIFDNICQAVMVTRQDVFFGKKMNWGEVGKVKLLRLANKNAIRYFRPVHEIAQTNDTVHKSKITLLHYSHTSTEEFISKINLYTKLESQYRHDKKEKAHFYEILFLPLGKLFYNLVIRLGVLDGWRGIIYGVIMSLHSLFVRIYLYELNQNK